MRRIAVLVMSISLMVTAIAVPSQAIAAKTKVTKPSAPTIVSVTSTKPKKGKVNVTVKIGLPASNGGSKITGSKVSFAGKSCTMKNAKTTCTIKGISEGTPLKIVATSKNKKGFGKKSKTTRYVAGFTELRFNIKNAAGLALSSSNRALDGARFATSAGSNLLATNAIGQVSNAVATGSASISKFLIAPNGNLFILFEGSTEVNGVECRLAEVVKESGIPICIDSSLSSISWNQRHKPIQFDAQGAIYYLGETSGPSSKSVLRKYLAGKTTDLINDFVNLDKFAVTPSGGVIVSGSTSTTGVYWIRYLKPNGELTLLTPNYTQSLDIFADGNIYFGVGSAEVTGLRQFNVSTEILNPALWIGHSDFSRNIAMINDMKQSCKTVELSLCSNRGTSYKSVHNIIGGKTFMIATSGGVGTLAQVFPNVNEPTISIKNITIANTLGGGVLITGLDASNKNKTIYFNADSGSETTLIPASSEIEIYHMTYNAATNKMMFDGLRFADNKYVFGQVDLGTNQLNIFSTLTSKWDDFQGFQ